jgi:hypothetical protein
MAKTKIEVDLVIKGGESVEQVETKTKSLKAQLKEMKALLASGTLDNQAFSKLSAEAGALQDQIGDVNEQVRNLASDSQKLDGFISITQGIVGGFAAVQGITAMVGQENEDLQETMVKLQGAMSALAGIQAVANTLNKTSAAYTTANTIATNISTFAQKQYALAVGTSTGAMKVFRIAMASLGIGLVIAAIGYLIANFDKLKTTVSKFLPSLNTLSKGFKIAYNAVTDFIGISSDATRKVDEFEKANTKKNKSLQNEIDILEALGGKEEQIYRKKSLMISNNILLLERQKLQGIVSAEEYQTKIEELRQEDRILEAEHTKSKEDELKKNQEKRDADAKARAEQALKERMRLDQLALKQREQDAKNEIELVETITEEERIASEKEEERKRQDTAFNIAWSLEQYQTEQRNKKRIAEQSLADQKVIEDARLSIMRDSYLVINNLGELAVGQQFKNTAVGKTLALTQIAIDTAMAISSLTKNSQANPANAVTGGISGIAQFASGMVQITGNMLKAKSILNGGGNVSTGGGGASGSAMGGGGMSSQPPRLDTFQSNRNSMNANQRVYVLEKDITDSQGRVARIRHNATLI